VTSIRADWLDFATAMRVVTGSLHPLPMTELPLEECAGHVLAADIVSPVDLPPWSNSAMDGYAVRAVDVRGAEDRPITLRVVDRIMAGQSPERPIGAGEAAQISTGAPIPAGADSVVRQEDTEVAPEGKGEPPLVRIVRSRDAGRNVRARGEDARAGDLTLHSGTVVTAGVIGVAASLGQARLRVIRRPRVAVLATGDELVELGGFAEVRAGRRIVSSNSYTLAAQLREAGCAVLDLGIAPDNPGALRDAIGRAAGCDALITSAGISVGPHDHLKQVLQELETEVRFWRVRIRPGSPMAFGFVGALGGVPWFGLPGNPVSSMVTFELFVRPAMFRLAGHTRLHKRALPARLSEDFAGGGDLTHFPRVRLEPDGAWGWRADPTGPQGSGILTSMARADGLLVIPPALVTARAGTVLPVIPLSPAALVTDAVDPAHFPAPDSLDV